MSLIDDALKRASKESTRRDGEKAPGRPWTPPPLPEHRRGIRLWMVVVALAIVGAAALFWLTASPRETAVVVSPSPAATAAPAPVATAAPAPVEVAPAPIEARPRPESRRPTREPASTAPPSAEAPAAEPPARVVAPPPAAVPAGIVLEGVVWSQSDPIAMINGRILRVGGVVEGYTITRIEPDAVELQGEKGTIRLKMGSGP